MSREVSLKGGPPPRDVRPHLTSPDRGLLTHDSRCLGSYALFVFLGRARRALREKLDVERGRGWRWNW